MIEQWLEKAVGVVWNYPVVGLCLLAGLFCTLRLLFIQIRGFSHALALVSGRYDHDNEPGELTHFQALTAALSGTVGLGNIAGVAIAISMGGPGAIFWMWVVAFFGMATKFMECSLGMLYRGRDSHTGQMRGGAMYYITGGMGQKWWPLATFFAMCLALGSFGAANMFQSNQVAIALAKYAQVPYWLTGLTLATFLGLTIIGGIKRIGQVTSRIVPTMCALYLTGALIVCLMSIDKIPAAIGIIFSDAFSGWAAAGGAMGVVVITGVRRAAFSNEAGLGTAPIAHSTVKTEYPIREGIVASLGPFIDTIVVCTATALVIIMSGNFGTERMEPLFTAQVKEGDNAGRPMFGGWTLTQSEIPQETEALRSYRHGEKVLSYQGGNRGEALSPAIPILNQKNKVVRKNQGRKDTQVVDGIRFSSYHGAGNYAVQLVDKNNGVIGTLGINEKGDELKIKDGRTGEFKPFVSITPSSGEGIWYSHVITFHDRFKAQAGKTNDWDELRLNFVAGEGASGWLVDRFQAVQNLEGVALTTVSFDKYLKGFGSFIITLAIVLFCYSTMITWAYYGEVATAYVFGQRGVLPFKILFIVASYYGAVLRLAPVLNFSDLMIGLMIIPNCIAMFCLSKEVVQNTQAYFARLARGDFSRDVVDEEKTKLELS